ncbi:MAG TPA: sensor domain-containing protein, partial [Coriobacteriia bacterium]|nr:sensor domain-containing protein [Coriobacteriia bacterium]
ELTVAAALRAPKPAHTRSGNPLARFFGVVADPQAWGALFYLLLALATGIIYFTIVVTGISLTLGTLVLIIGIPLALLTLAIVRAISFAEGRLVEGLLGVRMPRRPRVAGAQGDIWTRIKAWLSDWRTWTTMLYMLLQLPLGIIYFTLTVTAISLSAGFVAWPIVSALSGLPTVQTLEYAYYVDPWSIPLFVLGGLLGFVLTLWMVKGIGQVHGMYAKALLVGRVDQVEGASAPGTGTGSVASSPAPTAPAVPPVNSQGGDLS